MIAEKCCTRCNVTKPPTDFYRNRATRDGLGYHCKSCSSQRSKEWHSTNRKITVLRINAWRLANPAAYKAQQDRSYAKVKEKREAAKALKPPKPRKPLRTPRVKRTPEAIAARKKAYEAERYAALKKRMRPKPVEYVKATPEQVARRIEGEKRGHAQWDESAVLQAIAGYVEQRP